MTFAPYHHPVVLPTLRWFVMENSKRPMILRRQSPLALLGFFALLFVSFKSYIQYQDSTLPTTEEVSEPPQETAWCGFESVEKIFVL